MQAAGLHSALGGAAGWARFQPYFMMDARHHDNQLADITIFQLPEQHLKSADNNFNDDEQNDY